MVANLKKLCDEAFGPPEAGLKFLREILSGDTGKRLDGLLARIEKLSQDKTALPQVMELLRLIKDLDSSGGLDKLDSILQNIPRGQAAQSLISDLTKLMTTLEAKLDKVERVAKLLLDKRD